LSHFEKYHLSGNLKFNNLGIFQSLKLRILMGKILSISLQLNFTPNTLSCYRLSKHKCHMPCSATASFGFGMKGRTSGRNEPFKIQGAEFPW